MNSIAFRFNLLFLFNNYVQADATIRAIEFYTDNTLSSQSKVTLQVSL